MRIYLKKMIAKDVSFSWHVINIETKICLAVSEAAIPAIHFLSLLKGP